MTPRLVLALGAAAAALVSGVHVAALVGVAALLPLRRSADAGLLRATRMTVVAVTAATLLFTPLWLHLLVGVPERAAFHVGLALALRLDAVLLVGLALTATLPPVAWLAATRRFPRLGLALTLTFRQVPELAAESERIRKAQRARGLAGAHLWSRPLAVAVPLVVRSLERAERMGTALTLAGWTGGVPKTRVVKARWGMDDVLWLLLGTGLLTWALGGFVNPG